MNRFRFRLDPVLRLRRAEEDKKKREFGAAMRELVLEEQELRDLDDSLRRHEEGREQSGKGPQSVQKLRSDYNYARALEGRIDRQKKRVREKTTVVNGRRAALAESTKRKRVIERLKERRREEYDREVVKEEQAVIDDITSVRHKR